MSSQPNVIVFITHDTGRHVGPFGRGVKTPNLDRLAREGVIFDQAFCAAPQCSPSRASLLSGLVPHRHGLIGLVNLGFRLPAEASRRLLPAMLRDAGYATHLFGFQHESTDPHELGYEHCVLAEGVAFRDQTCRNVVPEVAHFLASRPREPFFAMVGVFETHRPFPPTSTPLDDVQVPPYLPDTPVVRRDVADLNAQVREVDLAVGQILDALDGSGHADDTLFLFTTDHGIAFPRAKATLFDPGIEITLIGRGPGGFAGGKRISSLVSNVDVVPTVLELCEVAPPEGIDGVSLLPLVRGEQPAVRDAIFAELTFHGTYDPVRAVRTARFKYIRSFAERTYAVGPNVDRSPTKDVVREEGDFERPRPRELLFDLASDPTERVNLAEEASAKPVLRELRDRLRGWMEETGDPLLRGDVPLPTGAYAAPVDSYDFRR